MEKKKKNPVQNLGKGFYEGNTLFFIPGEQYLNL